MKTDVVKPKDVFYNPTRLVVPIFQRPYVWSKEAQWAPLWQDIVRLIEVIDQHDSSATHFLGSIVIQQVPTTLGSLQTWSVIDGQQRLTTLQLLLSALYLELHRREWTSLAGQILPLVENPADYRVSEVDRYKLWPTSRDRDGYVSVMARSEFFGSSEAISSRLVEAHGYFAEEISDWIRHASDPEARARTLVACITDRLEIASIRLESNEDAQAIFETLNARGTPLSAADLIKNFVFQDISGTPHDAEQMYLSYWAEFETPWWESEVTTGRIKNSRASLFIWQWLVARTLEDFPIREVFSRFKHYVNTVAKDVSSLLPQLSEAAARYRSVIERSALPNGELSRIELFNYRVSTLDSEVFRPLLIWLFEPEQSDVTIDDKKRVLAILESWFVRRALVKVTSQGANRFIVDLMQHLNTQPKDSLVEAVERYLVSNHSGVGYWPGDSEVRDVLASAPAYTKYVRRRLRMILEAIEDAKRGYPDGSRLAMGPIVREKGTIEHLMPQKWRSHWSADLTEEQESERDNSVQKLGNLTLATQQLNGKISNGSWSVKRDHLLQSDDVLITRDAINLSPGEWDESAIERRTSHLIDQILKIWPVPHGHIGLAPGEQTSQTSVTVSIADLISSGWMEVGTKLAPRRTTSRTEGVLASISLDGRIFIGDKPYASPSAAAASVTGSAQNGWWWWNIADSQKPLWQLRSEYLESLGEVDAEVVDETTN